MSPVTYGFVMLLKGVAYGLALWVVAIVIAKVLF